MATVVLGAVAGYYVGTATLGAALLTSAIVTAGALIDSLYLYPALFPAKGQSKPQRFLDLQLPTADPGDPRVIAFGSDGVRVPCHVLFLHKQDELIGSGSGGKRGLRLYNVFVFGRREACLLLLFEPRPIAQSSDDGGRVIDQSRPDSIIGHRR
jgi:hypothetical protein